MDLKTVIRHQSLIVGRGGGYKTVRGEGQVKVYPYKKGGGAIFFQSHAEGGWGGEHNKFWGSFNTGA